MFGPYIGVSVRDRQDSYEMPKIYNVVYSHLAISSTIVLMLGTLQNQLNSRN